MDFRVHRQVLSEARPFFEKLFKSDWKENRDDVVRLKILTDRNLLWHILWISFTMVTLYLSSFASVVRALNALGTCMFQFSLITYTVVEQTWRCMTKRIQTSSQPTSFPSSHLFLERTLRPRLGANGHRCYRCWCNKRKRRKSCREVLTSSTQRENM